MTFLDIVAVVIFIAMVVLTAAVKTDEVADVVRRGLDGYWVTIVVTMVLGPISLFVNVGDTLRIILPIALKIIQLAMIGLVLIGLKDDFKDLIKVAKFAYSILLVASLTYLIMLAFFSF